MELQVKVKRVCYTRPNDDGTAWYILETDKGDCKGTSGFVPEKDQLLKLEGEFGHFQGQKQFNFKAAMHDIPISARDQLRYVCERTNGIGTAMQMQIWETWGDAWMTEVRPGVVSRLGGATYEHLRQAIDNFHVEKDKSEALAWLMGIGATMGLATSAWDQWGANTITVVRTNCYDLAELPNYGFQNVDKSIRMAFEIGDQDPRRIKASVVYSMNQLTERGSTVVTWDQLCNKCTEILRGMYYTLVSDCVREMFASGVLRAFPDTSSIALGKDYQNELAIWNFVNQEGE